MYEIIWTNCIGSILETRVVSNNSDIKRELIDMIKKPPAIFGRESFNVIYKVSKDDNTEA